MRPSHESILLSPEERRHAIAAVLAAGLLHRPRGSAACPTDSVATASAETSESGRDCLELSGEMRLSVHTG